MRSLSASRRRRLGALAALGCTALTVGAALPAVARAAFAEFYGGYSICGSNCYVQSAGAHTFYFNEALAKGGASYPVLGYATTP